MRRSVVGWIVGWFFLALLLWPLVYSVWLSFSPSAFLEAPIAGWSLRWYRQFFEDQYWVDALFTSLWVAVVATAIALTLATALAVGSERFPVLKPSWLQWGLGLPLFTPAAVLALGELFWLQRIGLWGTATAIALVHALVALPIAFLVLQSALRGADPDLELAARGLGASPWRAFRRVTLPLMAPGVLAAAMICFILSLNEFLLALFLGTSESETLPKVIWPSLRYTLKPVVSAASSLLLLVTIVVFAGVWALVTRRLMPQDRRSPDAEDLGTRKGRSACRVFTPLPGDGRGARPSSFPPGARSH